MMSAARWLVVIATSLMMLQAGAFVSDAPVAKDTCEASCGKHCPCCVSKAPASNPTAPLAPTPQSRVSVDKNFHVPVLAVLLAPVREVTSLALPGVQSVSSGTEAPLYQRHCIYLI